MNAYQNTMFGSRQECKYKYKIHNLVFCYGALCRVAWVTMMLILALRAAHNRAALAKQPFSVVGRNTITVAMLMMKMKMMVMMMMMIMMVGRKTVTDTEMRMKRRSSTQTLENHNLKKRSEQNKKHN